MSTNMLRRYGARPRSSSRPRDSRKGLGRWYFWTMPISPMPWHTTKTFDNGDLVSVSASHELVEMLIDPAINLMTTGPNPKLVYAYESADPVEALSFDVNGIPMSDFIHPAYFEDFHKPGSVRFDHLDKVNKPFQILSGGYQIIFRNGKWSQVFGSDAKKKSFAHEDRRGHRSEIRRKKTRLRAELAKIKRLELRYSPARAA